MARRLLRTPLARLAGAVALVALPVAASDDAPYRRGETIEFTGSVTDGTGAPLEGMTVVLLASHRGFELKSMRRAEEGLVRVRATTDSQGAFTIPWRWNPYYDTFHVRAEGSSRASAASGESGGGAASGDRPAALAEVDLTRRVDEGSPVVAVLEVADAEPHRRDRALAATPQSDDQRRVYEEMGKPDRVDRLDLQRGDEVAWWYFERGRSYHFRDGRLDEVIEFEPVKGF